MNKKLVLFVAGFVLTTGNCFAEEVNAEAAATAVVEVAAVEVGNTICPLSGRTLNLNDTNDFATLKVEGLAFNVCPKAKVEYNKDAAQFTDKLAQAVSAAKATVTVEAPAVNEVATVPVPTEVPVAADSTTPAVVNAEVAQ